MKKLDNLTESDVISMIDKGEIVELKYDNEFLSCWHCGCEIDTNVRPFCSDDCEETYACSMEGTYIDLKLYDP